VMVLDAASEREVGVISVPGAYTLDDTPDHTILWVGTVMGDVYTVDPVAMTVTNRYIGSQIGPSGFTSDAALLLADGQLALLGGAGGVSGDGSSTVFAIWNPTTNSLVESYGCFDAFEISGFSRTVDRTKLILADESGDLCEWDVATEQGNYFGPGGFPSVNFRISPDGNYLAVPFNTLTLAPNTYAQVYDLSTLALVNQFVVSGDTSTASGFAFSTDLKTLFVPNDWIIYAYDVASGQQVGWLPNMNVPYTSGGGAWGPAENPNLQASDNTGLLVGPMEEGVGFIDTTVLRTGPVGTQFTNGYSVPGTGPTSGGTDINITEPVTFGSLSGIYFGLQGSTDISGVNGPNTYGNFGSVSATVPSGPAGPTDIYVTTADGGMQLLPEGFSYGPTIIEVTPNMSTGEGGGTGIVYGYGFGPVGAGVEGPLPSVAHSTASTNNGIPSSLQVTVGGNSVAVTGFAPYAYPDQSPPFPLQAVAYTIPPGTAGSAVNVAVSTSSGSTTAPGALTYLPSIQQFPLTASTLAQGIYDSYTNLYYFTDTNQIQVFSRTEGSWQSPISIPAPPGTTQRLWGIALSPNGSKLAVSDAMAGAIYVLDPANPGSVKTFIVGSQSPTTNPCGLAISDAGNVYYMVIPPDGYSGLDQFFKLNTNTGAIFNYGVNGPGSPETDAYLRNAISSDNSRVFYNEEGYVFYVDTATDTLFPAYGNLSPCCYGNYDLALSSNQAQFEATGYFYDFNLNAESFYAQNDREILNITYVYGAKLSPDGRLFFQPSTNGIDVFDGYLGNLLNRISLPVALSPNYDALVADGADNVLVAITGTGNGIAIVDLTSVSEPPPLPYNPKSGSRQDRPGKQLDSAPHLNPPAQPKQPVHPSRAVRYVTRSVRVVH